MRNELVGLATLALSASVMVSMGGETDRVTAAQPESGAIMTEPFIGEIALFGGNFAPRGWALCEGQLLQISSHSALFSILGTTYGGDGRRTFALPDLRGRVALGAGQGPGLSPRPLGRKGGGDAQRLVDASQSRAETGSHLVLNYCIALVGVFPSRN